MTALLDILRAALAETNGDALAAAGAILRQCQEQMFRRALLEELSSDLMAESPLLEALIAETRSRGHRGTSTKVVDLERERQAPRENSALSAVWAGRRTRR